MNKMAQSRLVLGVSDCWCPPADPAGPKSFMNVALNLSPACLEGTEAQPSALLCCVLQALAIQGELQNKIQLFSKCQQHR